MSLAARSRPKPSAALPLVVSPTGLNGNLRAHGDSAPAAFRDELPSPFRGHEHAERLSRQTLFLTEFLDRHVPNERLGRASGATLVQLHCHQHAVLSPEAEKHVLDRLGLDYQIMKSDCCGMAGSFGFEREKYDVSIAAAERAMLPLLRNAAADTVVLANGFSCRNRAMHWPQNHARRRVAGKGTQRDRALTLGCPVRLPERMRPLNRGVV
jgi:hypothetical protein